MVRKTLFTQPQEYSQGTICCIAGGVLWVDAGANRKGKANGRRGQECQKKKEKKDWRRSN
jgi:hypothetical protein